MLLACAVTSKEHAKPERPHARCGEKNLPFHKCRVDGEEVREGERAGTQSAGVSGVGESASGEEDRGQPGGAGVLCVRGGGRWGRAAQWGKLSHA